MAEAVTIVELRRLVDEMTQTPYTDEELSDRIDADPSASKGELRPLAARIWREKAASFAGLIDVKEGSSDRKLSQLHKHALEMASGLSAGVGTGEDGSPTHRPTRTRPIERL